MPQCEKCGASGERGCPMGGGPDCPMRVAKENPNKPAGEPPSLQLPTDPVLRAVLIGKGVISHDDLTDAEATLRATGVLDVRAPGG